LDPWTTALLTNRDVLDIDQFGRDQRQAAREGDTVAWTASGKNGIRYLALFNLGDSPKTVERSFTFYNLPAGGFSSRELWSNLVHDRAESFSVTLKPHDCVLLALHQ
jgi:hypothetical protein